MIMAKRTHVSSETVYFDEVMTAEFSKVRDHYGRDISAAEVLRRLVHDKHEAIEGGETRRDQIKMLREDLDNMRLEFSEQLAQMREQMTTLAATMADMQMQLAHILKGEI
jgi:hypothetical protein